jgi:parallel beta-helix repeat protein
VGTSVAWICGPDPLTQDRAAGILIFQALSGSVISKNELSNNDVGVWLIEGDRCCRTSDNALTDNQQFGILIQDGRNQTAKNEISGGNVGVAAAAVNADAVATSRDDDISGTTVAPVQTFPAAALPQKSSDADATRRALIRPDQPTVCCCARRLYRPCRARPADRSLVAEDRSAGGVRDRMGPEPDVALGLSAREADEPCQWSEWDRDA